MRLVIAKVTPSGNELLRLHWAARKKEQNVFAALLLGQIRQHATWPACGKRRVTITRFGKRTLDTDNGYSGLKLLLDELVKFKLLIDDKPSHCELIFVQEKLQKNCSPHTVIELTDI